MVQNLKIFFLPLYFSLLTFYYFLFVLRLLRHCVLAMKIYILNYFSVSLCFDYFSLFFKLSCYLFFPIFYLLKISPAIVSPIENDDVAAGDGALQMCITLFPIILLKSVDFPTLGLPTIAMVFSINLQVYS